METLGYIGAMLMGVALGLLGGGGSILAVPVLVYLFAVPGTSATFYSLFIVGLCAAVAVFPYARKGGVEFQTALRFFVPSVVGVAISRRILLPMVPQSLSALGFVITKDLLLLAAFGGVMIAAAGSMIRSAPVQRDAPRGSGAPWVAANGIVVGMLTGFVGAGGGFLIVPALVNGLGLSMEKAVGTSLLIIALNSLLGFGIDLVSGAPADWGLIARFMIAAIFGIGLGVTLNGKVPARKLKPAFGWFVLAAGTSLVLKQIAGVRS